MSQQKCQSGQCAAFHFEIGDALTAFADERHDFLVLMGVCQWDAQAASLRSEESSAGDGHAPHHVSSGDALQQFRRSTDYVGVGNTLIAGPSHVCHKFPFEVGIADLVASGVEVEQAIEANAAGAGHESTLGHVGLQTAAGAYAYQLQAA